MDNSCKMCTDWPRSSEWYDELVRIAHTPVVALDRAVGVAEADGPQAGFRALATVPEQVPSGRGTVSS